MPLSKKVILSQHDIQLIRSTLTQREEWRNLLLFEICLYTARRSGNILDIKVGSMVEKNGKIKSHITHKNSLIMSDYIKHALSNYLKQYEFLPQDSNNYLFFQLKTYPLGKYAISRQMLWIYMKQRCHMTNISDEFSADSLRRTWAAYAYQEGKSLDYIRERLGFASLDMTKIFLGI